MENKNDIATRHFTDSFAHEAYDTPARAAWKVARSGLMITVIYSVVGYVLQKSINEFIESNS